MFFFVFFCFFGAKIWPAAADTGELGWDLRDPTQSHKAAFKLATRASESEVKSPELVY